MGRLGPRPPVADDARDALTRQLTLPRGPEREPVRVGARTVTLRGSETRTLALVGAFRVADARDLEPPRAGDRWHGDVEHLRREGLVALTPHVLDGQRTALVTLTPAGRSVLEHHRQPASGEPAQVFYAGLAKPREATHDAQLSRVYTRAAERLHASGCRVRRVVMDFELKRDYQRFLQERNREARDRSGRPHRSPEEIRAWADAHGLPVVDERVQFPDVRIEYEHADGRLDREDLELVTGHYNSRQMAAKQASGFTIQRSGASHLRGAARPARRIAVRSARGGTGAAMTVADRTPRVATYGFTPRQAAFLTHRHAARAASACRGSTRPSRDIAFGQNTRDFFAHLTDGRFATAHPCWRGAARIYHRPPQGALSRDRRAEQPASPAGHASRAPSSGSMVLDVVLADARADLAGRPSARRSPTSSTSGGLSADDLPALVFTQGGARTVRSLSREAPDRPRGRGEDVVFVYVVTDPTGRDVPRVPRRAIVGCSSACHRWTTPAGRSQRVARDARALHTEHLPPSSARRPLRPAVAEEFRWFCQARRALEDGATRQSLAFDAARFAARTPRLRRAPLLRRLSRVARARATRASMTCCRPRLHDAWTRGDGRVEIHVLPHQYQRPRVGRRDRVSRGSRRSPRGQTGGARRLRGDLAPASRRVARRCATDVVLSAARSDASRHLVVARGRSLDRRHGARRQKAAPCAARKRAGRNRRAGRSDPPAGAASQPRL